MRINSRKLGDSIYNGVRMPRKVKKYFFGLRIRKRLLRKMLHETKVGIPIRTMYERVEFTPHGAFCPKCGHRNYHGTGNKTTYPEHWEYFYCNRCRNVVGYIDNSPFIHALECADNNYDPAF